MNDISGSSSDTLKNPVQPRPVINIIRMGSAVVDESNSSVSKDEEPKSANQPYALNLALKKENLKAISEYSREEDAESAGFTRGEEEDKEETSCR